MILDLLFFLNALSLKMQLFIIYLAGSIFFVFPFQKESWKPPRLCDEFNASWNYRVSLCLKVPLPP